MPIKRTQLSRIVFAIKAVNVRDAVCRAKLSSVYRRKIIEDIAPVIINTGRRSVQRDLICLKKIIAKNIVSAKSVSEMKKGIAKKNPIIILSDDALIL